MPTEVFKNHGRVMQTFTKFTDVLERAGCGLGVERSYTAVRRGFTLKTWYSALTAMASVRVLRGSETVAVLSTELGRENPVFRLYTLNAGEARLPMQTLEEYPAELKASLEESDRGSSATGTPCV